MVIRKPSMPPPVNAPPPPPGFTFPQSNHIVDSSNLPPIPQTKHRSDEDSPHKDLGNPWVDAEPPVNNSRVGNSKALRSSEGNTTTTAASDVPDILKPGWSGQNTPRSSMDSVRSRDFWESSEDEAKKKKTKAKGKGKDNNLVERNVITSPSTEDLVIPSPLQIKRKPVGTSPMLEQRADVEHSPSKADFASNNPFRKPTSAHQQPAIELLPSWGSDVKRNENEPDSAHTAQLEIVSLNDTGAPSYAANQPSKLHETQWQQQQYIPLAPQSPPPPIPVPHISSPLSEQPPLIPVSPKVEQPVNPWSSQLSIPAVSSPIPFAPSQKQNTYSTENLLDRGQKGDGRISLGDELRALPNAAQTSTLQISLLDEEIPPRKPPRPQPSTTDYEYVPPPGPPPSHKARHGQAPGPFPPTKPPRPSVVVKAPSDAEIAQIQQQRNETYQIKHFNWFDHGSGKLRMSSMLTQNKNGPCPLLALVNALILGASDESQAALDNALKAREQVTLGLIIETLMDELLSSGAHLHGDLPDVDELNRFLMKLRTGMNMNPRFVRTQISAPNLMDARNSMLHMPAPRGQDQPGNFESSQDILLYSSFGIKTVHGWLPEPESEAVHAFTRSAQNYEDAQVIQFGEEELDYKLSHGGLTAQEQQLWEDIISIKNFFRTYPTQLTPYGLDTIKKSMQPGSFAILFRNDHFSTIYKHPRDAKLYTLITDAGYADRDEVIWESLVDISGQHSDFFSGDFQSVSHHVSDSERRRSGHLSVGSAATEPLSPQQQQEQHDADFAMALQLQEEEEQRMRQDRGSRSSEGNGPAGRGAGSARRGQGIPIPLRGNNSSTENRPLIPARNQRSQMPAVNRPSDAIDADAPPTYEEASRGEPYNPPLGSPLHPQSSASAEPSPYSSATNVAQPEAVGGQTVDARPSLRRPERRTSAYNENMERHGASPRSSSGRFEMGMSPAYSDVNPGMPGSYIHTGRGGRGQGVGTVGGISNNSGRRKDDNECNVM